MATTISRRCVSVVLVILLALAETYGDYKHIEQEYKHDGNSCSAVKHAYASKGYDRRDVPSKKVSGEGLSVCPQEHSCCTAQMETNLGLASRTQFEKALADKVGLLRSTFISRTAKFDAFFSELLENSKRDLHDMFRLTYGLLYEQNAHIFSRLYDDLRGYYKGRDVNLLDALDGFFIEMLQRMFQLLNDKYELDDQYLQCVTESMDGLKPFGSVPEKLSIQVKRAFIAARTFVQGLAIGRDVIIEVSKMPPSASCTAALMKMSYCPYCSGLPYVKPCNNYCMNVMKGCMAQQAELNKPWNEYIDALMKVAERLEGPFNIESVVDPIDVKISDAIMNFQESSENLKAKVFEGCGQPRISRHKREAAAASSYDEYAYSWKYERKQFVQPTTAAGTSLDRLVRDIKAKVEVAKDFWRRLPHSLCNDMAAPMMDVANCWNGQRVNRYIPEVTRDGVAGQINNPEVEVSARQPSALVQQQILQLRLVTAKLNNAYSGLDVDWIDMADNVEGGSGSGDDYSGSGAGGSGGGDNGGDEYFSSPGRPRVPAVVTRRPPPQSAGGDAQPNDQVAPAAAAPATLPSLLLLAAGLALTRW